MNETHIFLLKPDVHMKNRIRIDAVNGVSYMITLGLTLKLRRNNCDHCHHCQYR